MNSTEATSFIAEQLSLGRSKLDVLKDLMSTVPYEEDRLKYIGMVPDVSDRIAVRTLNQVLLVSLAISLLIQVTLIYRIVAVLSYKYIPWVILKGLLPFIVGPLFLLWSEVDPMLRTAGRHC